MARPPLEKEMAETKRMLGKYPDRVPLWVERSEPPTGIFPQLVEKIMGTNGQMADIAQHKYLVPHDTTVGSFVFFLRKRLSLKPEEAIYIFVRNDTNQRMTLPPASSMLKELYVDRTRYMTIVYDKEATFG